jgi:hypothetical protein
MTDSTVCMDGYTAVFVLTASMQSKIETSSSVAAVGGAKKHTSRLLDCIQVIVTYEVPVGRKTKYSDSFKHTQNRNYCR